MREISCDVLVVGGGTGGCAAAMAAADLGYHVILTEETDWIGGQLTSQAVPPDEHPWIETTGATGRYRAYRDGVREVYGHPQDPSFNPGGGWVSNLCHEPQIGHRVLRQLLGAGIEVRLRTVVPGAALLSTPGVSVPPAAVEVDGDRIAGVPIFDLESGQSALVRASYVVDATELGDLLALSGTEHVCGAESRDETGEAHAAVAADPDNQQGLTWVFALGYDPEGHRVIDRPAQYARWREFRPAFWPHEFMDLRDVNPQTLEPRSLPLFSDDWRCWFKYRQIVRGPNPVTIVNWPQNDYFIAPITNVSQETIDARLNDAREMSLSLLYWLQTECPRPDGGTGHPGLHLRPDITGTADGFAKTPYIRESRRLRARTTIVEGDVAAADGRIVAPRIAASVGVGAYRIDLHPSTAGDHYIDLATVPFQIPLGALVPIRTRNLLAAAKNIGSTHVTNGCYRLHPVEWNIGEAAGLLAAFCLAESSEPGAVCESAELTGRFQALLHRQGVQTDWPRLHAL